MAPTRTPPPTARHHVVIGAVSLLLAATATGCTEDAPGEGPGGTSGGDTLAAQLRGLPGVQDAEAGEVSVEQDTTGSRAVVDMTAEASPAELEGVVAALAEADVRESAVYLDAGTVEYDRAIGTPAVFDVSARTDPAATVALLEAGTDVLDGVPQAYATVAPDGDGGTTAPEPTVTLEAPGADPASLGDLAARVEGDEALQAARVVVLGGPEDLPPGTSPATLSAGPGGFTSDVADTWSGLVAAVEPSPVPAPPSYDAERARIDVFLVPDDGVVARDVTPTSYDGALQPVVEDLLDVLVAAPGGTTLQVWAARDYVLQVEGGEVGGRPRPGSWEAFASDYLASAGR